MEERPELHWTVVLIGIKGRKRGRSHTEAFVAMIRRVLDGLGVCLIIGIDAVIHAALPDLIMARRDAYRHLSLMTETPHPGTPLNCVRTGGKPPVPLVYTRASPKAFGSWRR